VPPTSLYSYAVSPGDTIVAVNDFPVWSLKDLRTQRSANPVHFNKIKQIEFRTTRSR